MKPLKTFLITIVILTLLSFLLDIQFIKENWLRYGIVMLLVVSVAAVAFQIIKEQIKNLN